ncbi:hypothetical protein KKF82_04925, partial [Patescibacteria group bacterium]|nr:hypothetical protein [Patescibacteria group bacterium]
TLGSGFGLHLFIAVMAPRGNIICRLGVTPLVKRVFFALHGPRDYIGLVVVAGVLPAYRAFHIDLQSELVKNGNFCIIPYNSVFFRLYLEGERLSAGPLE